MLRKILLVILAAAAVLALLAVALREPTQLVATASASQGPLTVSFTEEGRTRIRQRYVLSAPVAGQLRRIALQVGDAVQAGQTLAEIEPATSGLLDARTRGQLQAQLRGAQATLAASRQRSAAAQAELQLARSELARLTPLQAAGAASAGQLDQARSRAETARAQLAAARAEERVAQQGIEAARAQLQQGSSQAPEGSAAPVLAVRAPIDGQVLRRMQESATPVAAGQPLLEIGDLSDLELEVEVLSADAVQLAPGMAAQVLRWGGPGQLQARVRRIEPAGFTKVSALGVQEQRTRVLLDITSPRAQWQALGDAFHVEVEFITQQREQVLQVPASALFRSAEGWAVYRIEQGRARHTPVQIGLRAASAVQIEQGLQAGDTVVLQPDSQLHDGARVRSSGDGAV
ncbi:efflux RND transporter periplasmic adaptor subunit [Vandammella animalimorsus]|uniref:Efflux transporter periplasmic adaptor subunit n=1 Tax=Vandammella animalimorsus TaxID=2029117 RepID=A0A2A2AEE6_9BURK|nr:efflux RND transporter periplasmic adaptor subunit [Vandammella animalimorsus]PAT36118.1 efflux transporter periplasmic adaptor subunit [Vandammella animalimorsus]